MPLAKLHRCLVVLFMLLPIPVLAQNAITTQNVNVRAGPDVAFPLVTWIRARTPVHVVGCTRGWRWCDVVWARTRGWVDARFLGNFVRNRTPVVTFSVGPYWDAHFRNRPWYSDRSAWVGWGTPGFRPPGAPRG